MRAFTAAFVALSTFLAAVKAKNVVHFDNKCPHPVYFWTVGHPSSNLNKHDQDHEHTIIAPNSTFTLLMENTSKWNSGLSYKIRDVPYYQTAPAGIIQVEYTLDPAHNAFWYDLSAIDCDHTVGPENPLFCPLTRSGVKLYIRGNKPTAPDCPSAWCDDEGCHNVYMKHGHALNEPTYKCTASVDMVVELCTHGVGPRTFGGEGVPGVQDGAKVISTDGTCGGEMGYTCKGSGWGECCSKWGYCGAGEKFCGKGCQGEFGVCRGKRDARILPHPERKGKASRNGLCGEEWGWTCRDSTFGDCCSKWGYCGDSTVHCGKGCQFGYGECQGPWVPRGHGHGH